MASPQKNLGDSSLQHPKESFNSPSTISIGSLTQIIIDRLPRIPKNPSQCQKEILKHLKKSQRISKNPKESQRIPKISKNPQESFPQSEGDPEPSQKIPKNPQESQRISKNPTQSQKEILKHPKESQRIPKNPKESQRILNNSIELLRILENLGESWRMARKEGSGAAERAEAEMIWTGLPKATGGSTGAKRSRQRCSRCSRCSRCWIWTHTKECGSQRRGRRFKAPLQGGAAISKEEAASSWFFWLLFVDPWILGAGADFLGGGC